MNNNEEVIRKLAHQIWEAEGRPEGQASEHWAQANARAAEADNPDDAKLKRSIDPSEALGLIKLESKGIWRFI